MSEYKIKGLKPLYQHTAKATRNGPLFCAFPYPTKISPETIAIFIASHTKPGDTIFDGFAGSGTTGIATLLCSKPPDNIKNEAARLGIPVQWGPRRVVLCEIGALGSFISRTLCKPPPPEDFHKAAQKLLTDVEKEYRWMYAALDSQGADSLIRYTVWADILQCPSCGKPVSLWDACVHRDPIHIGSFICPLCGNTADLNSIERLAEEIWDDLNSSNHTVRLRRPAWVCGVSGRQTWARRIEQHDLTLLERIKEEPLPQSIPNIAINWGDLYRSGYHQGVTHLHHFYTRRNLIAFAKLWERVDAFPVNLQDALRFWLLSYNASHSTIMTRIVAKNGQREPVVTSAQPGVLYISGLPVEKNLFEGLRRKLNTITKAFAATYDLAGSVDVLNTSCLSIDLPDNSVDYIFTDPPFGGNIPYGEVNFINEAWLGHLTTISKEITISSHQKKDINNYGTMMFEAFREAGRLLKKDGMATVVFHSASAAVWNTFRNAYENAGFNVALASILDKTQGSFKQVTTLGAVRGDPMLLLTRSQEEQLNAPMVWDMMGELSHQATKCDEHARITVQQLYSRLVTSCVVQRQDVPIDAITFYRGLSERVEACGK